MRQIDLGNKSEGAHLAGAGRFELPDEACDAERYLRNTFPIEDTPLIGFCRESLHRGWGGAECDPKEGELFCRTSSGVRLCWELGGSQGPKGFSIVDCRILEGILQTTFKCQLSNPKP